LSISAKSSLFFWEKTLIEKSNINSSGSLVFIVEFIL